VPFRRVLVLGGARSGKSVFAERLATECGEPVLYVATASAIDEEMAERIAHHRGRRPPAWRTLELALELTDRVASEPDINTVLVDDLTLLLTNCMARDSAAAEAHALTDVQGLLALDANIVLVSNEVGMCVVPAYPLGRQFRDALGRLNQGAAAACDEVHLIVAGLPLRLK
jgi:adenosylcobinamide kinase / adenosylcobinamide-phosphate guanylyltransferase